MEKILDVKNLRISFRTNNGRVKAVRDISFDLNKGETIAIVGESGSGKSVTARAMMGILAPNAIVEGGEILYDGMDLMKISEEDFHQLRGNRISMIFQDPLSSLNPIVKIGKQLTEAMILNGKASQKDAKNIFNKTVKLLEETIVAAYGSDTAKVNAGKERISVLKKFITVSNENQLAYNQASEKLESCLSDIEIIRVAAIGKNKNEVAKRGAELIANAQKVCNPFIINGSDASYKTAVSNAESVVKDFSKSENVQAVEDALDALKKRLEAASALEKPNLFTLGYYLCFDKNPKSLDELAKDIPAMNDMSRKYIDSNYMLDFLKDIATALEYADKNSMEKKSAVIKQAESMLDFLKIDSINETELKKKAADLVKNVDDSINRLDIVKDSTAYTLKTALGSAVENYCHAMKLKSKKKLNRTEKITFDNTDYSLIVENMAIPVRRLLEDYTAQVSSDAKKDYNAAAVDVVDYLKAYSAKMVFKVTKDMAKNRAIKIMEEVGIPEARKRYNQYPFEFSGGMRQRIVIAIALSANPDIIICDEPTTALDVTIQSQILELINKLKDERKLSVIFITHDLGVVANMADKIAVMYAGKVVEYGTVDDIFYEPKHPYTWALLSSMPDVYTEEKLEAIPGTPPNMIHPPVGDAFAARNKYALKIDYEKQPPMFKVSDTHYAATWLLHPDAPKVEPPKIVTERINRMKNMEANANE